MCETRKAAPSNGFKDKSRKITQHNFADSRAPKTQPYPLGFLLAGVCRFCPPHKKGRGADDLGLSDVG
jgi:hypothetical protein